MVHYAFNADGVMYRVETQLCQNPEQVIKSLLDNTITFTGHLFNGVYCAIVNSGGNSYPAFIKEASHLRLSCQFSVQPDIDGSGELRHYIDYKGGVKASTDWVVPEGYRLFFCREEVGYNGYSLVMVNPEGNFTMIPMSNCYEDCTVCAGSLKNRAELDGLSVAERFDKVMDLFWTSYWNDHETTKGLFTLHNKWIFRWDLEMNQLPMVDPETHLPLSSPKFTASSAIADVMKASLKMEYADSTAPKQGEAVKEDCPAPEPEETPEPEYF